MIDRDRVKCPGCEVWLEVEDSDGQITHMQSQHPDIIEQRLRDAGEDCFYRRSNAPADLMVHEWLTLLGMTTEYMTAAEAVIEGLRGKLGVDTREEAVAESRRRTDAYMQARRKIIDYAHERQRMLSG